MIISVICPTFNSELYIQRTIDSIISQTISPNEVIFSDDGSHDKTIQIIEENVKILEKMGIKITVIKNNHSGPGKNRNIAMSKASGDWFAFLDSDDDWEYNKIERLNYHKKNNNKCNVFLNWEKFYRKNNTIILLKNGNTFNYQISLEKQLYKNNFYSTSAVTIHKSIYSKFGGFDTSLPNGQDYEYWMKIASVTKLCIIPEFLGNYYETKGNITQRPYRKKIRSLVRISYRYRNNVTNFSFIQKMIKITMSKEWIKDLVNYNL